MQTTLLSIPQVPRIDVTNPESADTAFSNALEIYFKPAQELPPGQQFSGGTAHLGWFADCLAFDVRLEDTAIWTSAKSRNDHLYLLGDTFELFAAVHGEKNYIEYHFAPNGLILQLQWPDNARLLNVKESGGLSAFQTVEDTTTYAVHKTATGWRIVGFLPATALGSQTADLQGQRWDISLSRYDYPQGGGKPILSSTSHFTEIDFHRRQDWETFIFE